MAIAYLNHTPIGKATQAQPYTAAAHLRYITRKQATNYVYSERMPVQYHAAQRFLTQREDTIRKNGRVCDKFIIALPREMSMEQGIDALRDFGWRLSGGKAPFLFSIQDFNSENPHAHFLYVDASIADGSRVFKTTDRDSTDRIKRVWADTCNEHLLELGREERIEFGKAEEIANDNHSGDANEKVSESSPAPVCAETPVEPDEPQDVPLPQQEEEFDVDNAVVESGAVTRAERIKAAVVARDEWTTLRSERDELARLEEAVRRAEQAALDKHTDFNIASMEASISGMTSDIASERVDTASRGIRLKLPSLNLGLFRTPEVDWKSGGRKNFEAAKAVRDAAAFRHQVAVGKAMEQNAAAARAAREALTLEKRRQELEFHLRTRGTTEELIEAERIFENTVRENTYGLTTEQVFEEYESGGISAEEAKQALALLGKEDAWTLYEEMNGIDRDEGLEA